MAASAAFSLLSLGLPHPRPLPRNQPRPAATAPWQAPAAAHFPPHLECEAHAALPVVEVFDVPAHRQPRASHHGSLTRQEARIRVRVKRTGDPRRAPRAPRGPPLRQRPLGRASRPKDTTGLPRAVPCQRGFTSSSLPHARARARGVPLTTSLSW
jgi:hypothetical protein